MSSLSSLVLLLVVLVQALLVAGQCPNGAQSSEITTPGLIDGFLPETGVLIQQPADELTLWPVSVFLINAYQGNITAFTAALGVCEGTGCKAGNMQIGLYHYHVFGTLVPEEAGKFHLISYSSPFKYYPHSKSGSSTKAKLRVVKAHAQHPNQQLIPISVANAPFGYYIGIISSVPYGIYTGGLTFLPFKLTRDYVAGQARQGRFSGLLPANPAFADFQAPTIEGMEASLGFFYCPYA